MDDLKNYRVEISENLYYNVTVVPDFDKKLPQDYIKAFYRTMELTKNVDFLRIYFPGVPARIISMQGSFEFINNKI